MVDTLDDDVEGKGDDQATRPQQGKLIINATTESMQLSDVDGKHGYDEPLSGLQTLPMASHSHPHLVLRLAASKSLAQLARGST